MINEKLQQTTVIDGIIYDSETGECLGTVKPEFHVTDQASAEWVLEKASALDQDIAGLTARKNALIANMDVMIKEKSNQKAGLLYRFGPELEHFAKENLPKGKKTWTCPFGSVGFRATQAKIEVQDEERAMAWAKQFAPEAIKVKESLLKSLIPDDLITKFLDDPTGADAEGFTVVPAGESATIKTGI